MVTSPHVIPTWRNELTDGWTMSGGGGRREGEGGGGQVAGEKMKLVEQSKQRNLDLIAGAQSLLSIVILCLACAVAFASRLFAVIRFESIIHEFDPW